MRLPRQWTPVCGPRHALNGVSLYLSPNYHNLPVNCETQGDAAVRPRCGLCCCLAAGRLWLWPGAFLRARGSSKRKWTDVKKEKKKQKNKTDVVERSANEPFQTGRRRRRIDSQYISAVMNLCRVIVITTFVHQGMQGDFTILLRFTC